MVKNLMVGNRSATVDNYSIDPDILEQIDSSLVPCAQVLEDFTHYYDIEEEQDNEPNQHG